MDKKENEIVNAEDQIFGKNETGKKENKKTVEIDQDQLTALLERMSKLEAMNLQGKDSDVFDPLKIEKKTRKINIAFYNHEGKDYIITGYEKRKMPNGIFENVYNAGMDERGNPIFKCQLKGVDVNTGKEKVFETHYEWFIKNASVSQVESMSWEDKIVDLTPADESVPVITYGETGKGTIVGKDTGTRVRLAVRGIQTRYSIVYNDQTLDISSDVINLK
jgi:hypothetical protein